MHRSMTRVASAAAVAVALGLAASLVGATGASAAVNANVGGPAVFSVSGTNLPSNTVFNLTLPNGAACSAGGATGELYYSFLVSAGTDLTQLTYLDFPPQPDEGTGLITPNGHYLPSANQSNGPPGEINPQYGVGLEMAPLADTSITGLTLTGAELPIGAALIPAGQTSADWVAGVVCMAPADEVTDYWSAPLTFTVSSADPSGFVWTPAAGAGPPPIVPESPLAVGLPLGAATVVIAVVFVKRRRESGRRAAGGGRQRLRRAPVAARGTRGFIRQADVYDDAPPDGQAESRDASPQPGGPVG